MGKAHAQFKLFTQDYLELDSSPFEMQNLGLKDTKIQSDNT